MGLYITFIITIPSQGVPGLCCYGCCVAVLFLVTFMVMAAKFINLYMNLVIVLCGKVQHFVSKATVLFIMGLI